MNGTKKTIARVALAGVAIAGTAAAAPPATKQVVTGPVATYWMSAQTTSGMTMGGGAPSLSSMMGMGRGGNVSKSLILQLGSARRPTGEPSAEHLPPAVLKADVMTLVTDQQIGGDHVTLAFYHTDQSPRARVEMKNALLDQATGLLEAGGGVTLRGDRIEADGSGLIYHMEKAKGFLTGPAETRIRAHNETTMNHQNRLIRPAAALAGAALLTAASAEQKPAAV